MIERFVHMRHLLTLFDLTADEIHRIFEISATLKQQLKDGVREQQLPGRVMALLFEKQSLRTRVSFETLMTQLGGGSLFLGQDVGWGSRESRPDFAQVLSGMVDIIVCRAESHDTIEQLAKDSSCPVVNGLSDEAHPCQALTDLFTVREVFGSLEGAKLAYVGDANNVARSLAIACGQLGISMAIASPEGYQFDQAFVDQLQARISDFQLVQTTDPREAAEGASAVYADVWTSMGQESEQEERKRVFAPFQVTNELMSLARQGACFLHCMPAHRGEEVTAEVADGPQSAMIQQAINRLHVQKGLVVWLLAEES